MHIFLFQVSKASTPAATGPKAATKTTSSRVSAAPSATYTSSARPSSTAPISGPRASSRAAASSGTAGTSSSTRATASLPLKSSTSRPGAAKPTKSSLSNGHLRTTKAETKAESKPEAKAAEPKATKVTKKVPEQKSLSGRVITKRTSKQELPIPAVIKEKEITTPTPTATPMKNKEATPLQLQSLLEGEKDQSTGNLSTHVNVSSDDLLSKTSPEEEDEELRSFSTNNSPVVSDGEDATREMDEVPESAEELQRTSLAATNRLLTGLATRVNKRSESDGIVVAERPKPDKPVRRCESIDDATEHLNHAAAGGAKFGQGIKTVASATIVKGPEDQTVSIGDTVNLAAHYFGNPEPRVTWLKNGSRIEDRTKNSSNREESAERVVIRTYSGESTLILKDVRADDSGKYEVHIENEVGNDAAVASLGVEGPPEPPAGRPFVSDIAPGSSSLTLAWYGSTFDGGSIVTGYLVEMSSWFVTADSQPPEPTDWTVLTSDCHSTSYIVKGLDPDKEYIFRVKAQNVHGASQPSRVSEPVGFNSSNSGEEEDGAESPEEAANEDRDEKAGGETSTALMNDPSFEAPFEHRIVALEQGEIFKSKFEIYEELGRGRFGVVFKCQDKSTKEQFAAKFIRCRKREEKQKVRRI